MADHGSTNFLAVLLTVLQALICLTAPIHLSIYSPSVCSSLKFPTLLPSLPSFLHPFLLPPSSHLTLSLSSSAHHDYGPWKGLLHQAHEWLDGIEESGGATRLQDETIPGH